MWFSNDFEKDKVFRTRRDTRCLNVLLNRSSVAGFSSFFTNGSMSFAGVALPHRLPKSRYRRWHTGDKPEAKIPITCVLRLHPVRQCKRRQSHECLYQELTRPTACSLCCPRMTIIHRIETLTAPLFLGAVCTIKGHLSIFLINIGKAAIVQKPGRHERFQPEKCVPTAIGQSAPVLLGRSLF